jgi:hypothetical protein
LIVLVQHREGGSRGLQKKECQRVLGDTFQVLVVIQQEEAFLELHLVRVVRDPFAILE